jgi:hypothetical protein
MTTAPVDTQVELLYLSIDVGDAPSCMYFRDQVDALTTLQKFCFDIWVLEAMRFSEPATLPEPASREFDERLTKMVRPHVDISGYRVIRTSMASPWITVLGDIANTSKPVAYSIAGLFGLHKLMNMIMEWQNHREAIRERRQKPDLMSIEAGKRVVEEFLQQEGPRRAVHAPSDEVGQAASTLGPVLAAEMISQDDPRATV